MLLPETLFERALQLEEPWKVSEIEFDQAAGILKLCLDFPKGSRFSCPKCRKEVKAYDTEQKRWRHLNFFQYECVLEARVPRINCETDGILQVEVPWARSGSGFTLWFEALVMVLAREMPMNAAGRIVNEYSNRLWRIVQHYVGVARSHASYENVTAIGVDETSISKGHNYVTIVADMENRRTIYATEGRGGEVLGSFVEDLAAHGGSVEKIKQVSMDMSPAYISGAEKHLPEAKITFDKFHVIKVINDAVDEVRRTEVKECQELKQLRYVFLKNRENLTQKQKKALEGLESISRRNYKTLRALHIRENFQQLYQAETKEEFEKGLKDWFWWATHSRLEPIREAAHTIKRHWQGILQWFDSRLTNGFLEGLGSLIQAAKAKARGYRKSWTFITVIYLLTGKLDFTKSGLPT